jgi:hypothetical protein
VRSTSNNQEPTSMKTTKLLNISFIFSLLLFNYFFWQENLGINLLIFSVLLIGVLLLNYRKAITSMNVKITVAGTIITSIMVMVFNSTESKIAQIISFMLMVAFIHENGLKSVVFASMHMLASFVNVPSKFFKKKNESLKKLPRVYFVVRIARLSLIPLGVAFIFFLLYCMANPIFGNYASIVIRRIFNLISDFFVIFGAFILSVIYFRNEAKIFLEKDLSFSEKLNRIKKLRTKRKNFAYSSVTEQPVYPFSRPPFKSIALKNQNRRGIILLLMVNVLLLLENIVDIKWLWFGFQLPESFSLQHYVREGTGFLIASILLSIGVLLYYFRRNQNFYPKNKLLKTLAYLWIAQNLLLCFSVYLRNYHYIDFHGLAYKRIGVMVFISLTIFGLVTLYNKIRNIKSVYYLLRMNTWALYGILVLLSCYNWDVNIAKYNLAHWNKGEIDVDFYLQLSDKALPIVFENLDSVKTQIEAHKNNKVRWITYLDYDLFVRDLQAKRERFMQQYNEHSWLSFNFPDRNAYKELTVRQFSER